MRSGGNFDTNYRSGVCVGGGVIRPLIGATAFHARCITLDSRNVYFPVAYWYPPVPFALSFVFLRLTVYAVNRKFKQTVKLTDKPILLFMQCRVFFEQFPVDNHWLRIDFGMAQVGGNIQLFMWRAFVMDVLKRAWSFCPLNECVVWTQ